MFRQTGLDAYAALHLKRNPLSGNRIRVRFRDLSRTGADYYYVIVRQDDDSDGNGRNDEAISPPIWID